MSLCIDYSVHTHLQVAELDARANDDKESVKAAAAEERARREKVGIGDRVQVRQPIQPPKFNAELVGRHLEVRCKVDVLVEGTNRPTGETSFVWWSCKVLVVSDGNVPKIGARGQPLKEKYPIGFASVEWRVGGKS